MHARGEVTYSVVMKSDLLLNKSRESSFLVLDDVRSDKYTLNGSLTLHGKVVLVVLFFLINGAILV